MTTATPTKPTKTTGGGGVFFDSPSLSKDVAAAATATTEPGQAVKDKEKPGPGNEKRRRGAGPRANGRRREPTPSADLPDRPAQTPRTSNSTRSAPAKQGIFDSPGISSAVATSASAATTTVRPPGSGKSVFDSPVSARRVPQPQPQGQQTTPASLKPNGRSVFSMPDRVVSHSTTKDGEGGKVPPRIGKQGKRVPGGARKGKKGAVAVVEEVGEVGEESWYRNATLEDILDELSSRFILNLPQEELASPERVCFQIEQAHWFYEDFIREESPTLPTYRLKDFCKIFFAHSPLLSAQWGSDAESERAFERFLLYKKRVPVCGAIMLNQDWTKCVLVKGWKAGSSWGFPKGKMNNEEPKHLCAIREVEEETGYNCASLLNKEDYIQMTMNDQEITLFVVTGVPEETAFAPQTRKEISAIEWFELVELPTWFRRRVHQRPVKYFMIAPFVAPLKEWMKQIVKAHGSSSETDEAVDQVVHVDPEHQHEEHEAVTLSPNGPPAQQQAITSNVDGGPSVLDDLFSKFTVASEKKEAKHGAEQRQRAEDSKADPAMQVILEKLMAHGRKDPEPAENPRKIPDAGGRAPDTQGPGAIPDTLDSKQGKQQALMDKLMSSLGATPVKSPLPNHVPAQDVPAYQMHQNNGQLPSTPSKQLTLPFGMNDQVHQVHHPYSAINEGGLPMPTHNPALAGMNGHVHPALQHLQGPHPSSPHSQALAPNTQPAPGFPHMTANLLNVLTPSRPVDPAHLSYSPRHGFASPPPSFPGPMQHPTASLGQTVPPPMHYTGSQMLPTQQNPLLGMLSSPQPHAVDPNHRTSDHPLNGPLPGPIQLPLQSGMPELNRILPYQSLPTHGMDPNIGYLMHNQPPPQFQQMHPSHALSPPHHPASTAQAHQLLSLLNPRDHVQTVASPPMSSAKTADGLLAMLIGNNRHGQGQG